MRWLVAGAVLGCTPGAAPVVDAGSGSPESLGSSLNVRVAGDTVELEIHITNVTSGPIVLEFPSTQRYDFAVSTGRGETVWQWSAARSFATVLGEERLEPGATRRYTAQWPAAVAAGEYVATGWVVSTSHPVELRTEFRVPAEDDLPE
jgi:hypothetical protein